MTKQKDRKTCINAGLAGAAGDVVSRYGSGVKEHIVAYGGVDNETGQTSKRSLKKISNYNRGNSDALNYDRVTKSQAGFSAEVKEVARRRAEEVIQGKKPTTVRTDDISGHMNDPLFDITSVISSNGDPISGASIQMKFMGSSPENAVDKMLGKSFQKYIDNNVKIMVPSDYYDGMKAELQKKIVSLEKKIERLKEQGKTDVLKQAQLDKYKVLDKNLQKSKVSNKEALEARNTPRLSTAKDVLRTGHRAGVKQAKTGALKMPVCCTVRLARKKEVIPISISAGWMRTWKQKRHWSSVAITARTY
ncbi:MAG: hypothetical protein BWY31_01111 [Lentisphaerae bacterium ADurb.Bin242]|nr:MAG: hypothetical protein BWY31_01111 [Lentisphaerae bacterium ADurb.Bin242]